MKAIDGELFRFRFLTEVRFGVGVRAKLPEYLEELGAKRIVLFRDEPATSSGAALEVVEILGQATTAVHEISPPPGEPDIQVLEDFRPAAREFSPDLVIGIGGGSVLDYAKGLAAVLPNVRHAAEYQGFDKTEQPGLASLMIPTLFGSGAEVTASAVMINKEKEMKGGINGRFVFPRLAVIDPELGPGTPRDILGGTGLDALVHSIEGYVAKCATPYSSIFSREAVRLLLPALQSLAQEGDSVEAYNDLAFGALLAITGLMHSESGVCGAISYPLGVHHMVPHGLAGGLVMPAAIEYNANHGCELYGELMGKDKPHEASSVLADTIRGLIREFELPRLDHYGVTQGRVDRLSNEIFNFKGILDLNPIKINEPEIIGKLISSAI